MLALRSFRLALLSFGSCLLAGGIFIGLDQSVIASSGGITGASQTGCGTSQCHSSPQSAETVIQVTPDVSTPLLPSTAYDFEVRVTNPSATAAGVDISLSPSGSAGGTLVAGSGLRKSSGELTHSSPRLLHDTGAVFRFKYTTPTDPKDVTMRIAANAVNLDGSASSADQWNRATLVYNVATSDVDVATATSASRFTNNPASSATELELSFDRDAKVDLFFIEPAGNRIRVLEGHRLGAGLNSIPLSLAHVKSGAYTVQVVESGRIITSCRLIVVK